jgi:hypothetical protein
MSGGSGRNRIARWDGATWQNLTSAGMNNEVYAVQVHNTNLIAGGAFTTAGGGACNGIASWNGTAWSALGQSLNNIVEGLAVYKGELIAGGRFTSVNANPGLNLTYVARWTGATWLPLVGGMDSWVHGLAVSNSKLYACGLFTAAGSSLANRIAAWPDTAICAGDINGDDVVNIDDLLGVISGWGSCP